VGCSPAHHILKTRKGQMALPQKKKKKKNEIPRVTGAPHLKKKK